ncbi:GntR family transcriptional regulator [Glacieibacterium sp.]|uniref:GntR family transcriptional regulator n=1 Tax=Glacieibacterium sp. TaxID=2860237 RepID=UPI003B000453
MFHGDRPIYLQIRDIIVARIIDRGGSGSSGDGEQLPSVRALAAELEVNPLTVAKAYQELQAAGLVAARKGVGLYVEAGARLALLRTERAAFLKNEWPHIAVRIERLGLTPSDLFADA